MLPLRSVGRSNFDKGLHSLTTLIQKRNILMRTAVYIYICIIIRDNVAYIYVCVCLCLFAFAESLPTCYLLLIRGSEWYVCISK